jgi:hypothetical protein
MNFLVGESMVLSNFSVSESMVLPCVSGENMPAIESKDIIGNLALVDPISNLSNRSDCKVDRGILKDASGKLSFEAYKIYKPLNAGDPHRIFFKFPTQEDYTIYDWYYGGN